MESGAHTGKQTLLKLLGDILNTMDSLIDLYCAGRMMLPSDGFIW